MGIKSSQKDIRGVEATLWERPRDIMGKLISNLRVPRSKAALGIVTISPDTYSLKKGTLEETLKRRRKCPEGKNAWKILLSYRGPSELERGNE